MNKSIAKEKIMDKISAFSYWDVHSHNFDSIYLLFNIAAFDYIFDNKDKFVSFKRATRGQGLLCDTEVITIKGWGEILLSLRIRN